MSNGGLLRGGKHNLPRPVSDLFQRCFTIGAGPLAASRNYTQRTNRDGALLSMHNNRSEAVIAHGICGPLYRIRAFRRWASLIR